MNMLLIKSYYRGAQVGKPVSWPWFDDNAARQVLSFGQCWWWPSQWSLSLFLFLHLSLFLYFQACVFAFSTTDHSSLLAVRKWRKKVRRPPCWRSLAPRTTKITQKMTCMPYWFFKTMDKKVIGWGGDRVMPKGCSQPELTLSVLLVLMVMLVIFTQLPQSCSSCRWCWWWWWYWCWCWYYFCF